MTAAQPRPPVQPGEPAPEFTLPAASGEGSVSLAQYRGKSPLYLALFRGLYCSFCRRHVVHLGSTAEKLREAGVQTLGVVATDPERARFYFKFRPPRMPIGADPELATHQAYGLPNIPITPEAVDVACATSTVLSSRRGCKRKGISGPRVRADFIQLVLAFRPRLV